ncbi:transglutaminase [Sphingomonas oleivorans]|uniref:Transglutaminase n=1 Tax=Sphingomonas oleivorans TaxID=1735121 RepID=A0A2T5FUK4_9SPHN|nr:transglutaminase family protein [Sphingomonas oleivorans]PTQ08204.1 transglutaminase [Sphingomonas oleivorans]
MRLFVHHRTEYRFSEPQQRVVQLLRLTPGSHEGQNVVDWHIDVACDARLKRSRDGYGNEVTMLYVDGPIERIGLTVTGEVLTIDRAGLVSGTPEPLPPVFFTQTTALTAPCSAIRDFAHGIEAAGGNALDRIHRLNHALYEYLQFGPRHDSADRTAAETFEAGNGVCRDFAHVFIAAARLIGFPARYVSGHFYRPETEAAEYNSAHGWAEAYVEDYGWIAFDPANDICPHDAYVRVATGLDYRDAAPVSGQRVGGGHELLEIGVRVGLSQTQIQTQS